MENHKEFTPGQIVIVKGDRGSGSLKVKIQNRVKEMEERQAHLTGIDSIIYNVQLLTEDESFIESYGGKDFELAPFLGADLYPV